MKLVNLLKKDFPQVSFIVSEQPHWSPKDCTIFYNPKKLHAEWSLLHEVGHMLSNHKNYDSDIDLIKMEVEAWEKAKELAKKYSMRINKEHIEDCLDSYRDWLYKRSLCPECKFTGLEEKHGNYSCINCKAKWKVGEDRFTRVYRKTKTPA